MEHEGQHTDCDPCFVIKMHSVSFSASAMPSRSGVGKIETKEKQLHKDRDAYKAMKEQGIQPAKLHGAADLQDHASTKHEIETGRLMPKSIATKVENTVGELKREGVM